MITTCRHPECSDYVKRYSGRGPRSAYCVEHSKPKHRMARSRAGIDARPECCRAQDRGVCKQHRKPKVHSYGRDLNPDSVLAGDEHITREEKVEAQFRDVLDLGLRISSPWGAIACRLTWARERWPVIGQPDLAEDWLPINPEWRTGVEDEFPQVNSKLVTELVWRSPEWPWGSRV